MNKIIAFRNKKEFKKIIKNLKKQGYKWVHGDRVSFEEIKNTLPKQTRTFAICFYYNPINKKLEMQYHNLNFYKKRIKLRNKHGFTKNYEIVTL